MEQRYAVYVRDELRFPETPEVEVAEFASFSEARRLRRELGQGGIQCVVRTTGETGGSG